MQIREHAEARPDKPAVILHPSGTVITFDDLEARANRLAHRFRQAGLGEGETVAGDQGLRWSKGDGFVVPNWCPHRHRNLVRDDALLFSVTDAPLLKAARLYREEAVS